MRAGGRQKRTIEPPKIATNRRQQKAQEKKQQIIEETRKIQILSEIENLDEIDDDEMDEHATINIPKSFPYGEKDSDTIFIRPIHNQRQLKKWEEEKRIIKEIEFNNQKKIINPQFDNFIDSVQSSNNINAKKLERLPEMIQIHEINHVVVEQPQINPQPVVPQVVQIQNNFIGSDLL